MNSDRDWQRSQGFDRIRNLNTRFPKTHRVIAVAIAKLHVHCVISINFIFSKEEGLGMDLENWQTNINAQFRV